MTECGGVPEPLEIKNEIAISSAHEIEARFL